MEMEEAVKRTNTSTTKMEMVSSVRSDGNTYIFHASYLIGPLWPGRRRNSSMLKEALYALMGWCTYVDTSFQLRNVSSLKNLQAVLVWLVFLAGFIFVIHIVTLFCHYYAPTMWTVKHSVRPLWFKMNATLKYFDSWLDVSTLLSSVFISGDMKLPHNSLYTLTNQRLFVLMMWR